VTSAPSRPPEGPPVPPLQETPVPVRRLPPLPGGPERKARPRVLIVDDAPENLRILLETLKEEFTVVAANGGERALRLAFAPPHPDCVLLDVSMPGMDGYEVCARLKADPRTAEIPVLFLTARTEEEDEARGLELGAADYLYKPFRPGLIRARIHNQVELKRHRDHLEDLVQERTRELLRVQTFTFESLANLAESRDPETGGHIRRTRLYVGTLARAAAEREDLGRALSPGVIDLMERSAPLHDIGKVAISDRILLKPGRLTPEEFEEMKTHTTRGRDALLDPERLLEDDSFLRMAREIAYGHHERWDGRGYPRGFSGEAIPLAARIMAVADVYDALTSRRIYKPALPHGEAVRIIAEGRGTQFDPRLVEAFLSVSDRFERIGRLCADPAAGPAPATGSEPAPRSPRGA